MPSHAAIASPEIRRGSHSAFCASLPPAAIARARRGEARAAGSPPPARLPLRRRWQIRPCPALRRPCASAMPTPDRPSSVQKARPQFAVDAVSCHRLARAFGCGVFAKKALAVSAIIACSSVKANSIRRSPTLCAGLRVRRAACPPLRRHPPGPIARRHRPPGLRASHLPA